MPGVTAGGIGLVLLMLLASTSGPLPAHTGGFGEMTCLQCHWDNPPNDAAGTLSLSGIPERYTPGERYPITVSIAHPELVKGGFQLSARLEDGANAGVIRSSDDRTEQVSSQDGRVAYVQHTRTGSVTPTKGRAEWRLEWTAPRSGPVVFHAAGNAANGDASPLGDFVYTATVRVSP